jgi:predicted nucleic acid-binding protein
LIKAKEAGLINAISPLIEILKESQIFIDDKTYALVLEICGEK